MDTDKNNFVYFGLSGEFDPEVVAAEIEIKPTLSAAKHSRDPDRRQPRSSILRYAQIQADSECKVLDFYRLADQVVEQLEPYADQLRDAAQVYKADATFQLVLAFPVSDAVSTPILGFSRRVIKFIAATGAEVDIDTYRG